MNLDAVTAEGYREYLMNRRHPRHGGLLGKSAYQSRQLALFHLFHLHNRRGFPEDFWLHLGNLFRGFYRQLPWQWHNTGSNGSASNGLKEGKDAISITLYQDICLWFLDWGTLDGVFAYCFLVPLWNLACHSNNTAFVHLSDINDLFLPIQRWTKLVVMLSIQGTCTETRLTHSSVPSLLK